MIGLAELKRYCRVTSTREDDLLVELEQAAVAYVQRITGRSFGAAPAAAVTHTILGTGIPRLWLPEPAALLPATVIERAYPGSTELTITASAADGYVLRNNSLALVRKEGGIWGRGYEYGVAFISGYSEGNEPADIRQAVRMLTAHWYENRIPVALGTVAPEIAHTLTELLGPWRRRPWA